MIPMHAPPGHSNGVQLNLGVPILEDRSRIGRNVFILGELPCASFANRITSEQKSLFTATYVLFYFLHAILYIEYTSANNNHRSLISQLSPRTVFSDLALWRHHGWSVSSSEREILTSSLYIRRLFLHAQIDAKAIFNNEWQWITTENI